MPSITTDPSDPRLGHGSDDATTSQHEVYLVLSDEERQKGFVRPVRRSYRHIGKSNKYPLRDLTDEQKTRYPDYVKYEAYPESELPQVGKYWTQEALDKIGNGCGTVTTMGQAIAETYAREPHFYGSTYCVHCEKHLPVDEFVWEGTRETVGS